MFAGCGLDIIGQTPLANELNEDTKSTKDSSVVDSGESRHDLDAANEHDASPEDADAGADAVVDAGPCPAVCTRCEGSKCIIECPGKGCSQTIVACPSGRDCVLQCKGDSACSGLSVNCPNAHGCSIECPNNASCSSLAIYAANSSNVCLTCSTNSSCSAVVAHVPAGTCRYRCGTSDDDDNACKENEPKFYPNCTPGPCL